jgi:flagellar motor switch protein FliN
MDKSALTQREIDALMNKRDSVQRKVEEDYLRPILSRLGKSIGVVLSVLFDATVKVQMNVRAAEIRNLMAGGGNMSPFVVAEVDYISNYNGSVLFCINQRSANVFVDLMMAGKGTGLDLNYNGSYLGILLDVFDQVALGVSRAIGEKGPGMNKPSYPEGNFFEKVVDVWEQVFSLKQNEPGVLLECMVTIEGLEQTSFVMFIPDWFVVHIREFKRETSREQHNAGRFLPVRSVKFGELPEVKGKEASPDFELIADVPLQISVELGHATMQLKDILQMHKGSVIELDKLAGDPADVFINGKMFAKGEVVVAGENFGVKLLNVLQSNLSSNNK